MGRGESWSEQELRDLFKARVSAREDPIVGIDKTANLLDTKIYREFIWRASSDDAGLVKYKSRPEKSAKDKFDNLSTDVQKSRRSLRTINVFQKTGVTENRELSMASAIHFGMIRNMSYYLQDLEHTLWCNNLEYQVLRKQTTFSTHMINARTIILCW